MADFFPPTLDEQVTEATRELAMRRSAYPRRVADKKMKQSAMDRQIAVQESIIASLKELEAIKNAR